jgi:hypothetical protein
MDIVLINYNITTNENYYLSLELLNEIAENIHFDISVLPPHCRFFIETPGKNIIDFIDFTFDYANDLLCNSYDASYCKSGDSGASW